jgi:hypothetical protein
MDEPLPDDDGALVARLVELAISQSPLVARLGGDGDRLFAFYAFRGQAGWLRLAIPLNERFRPVGAAQLAGGRGEPVRQIDAAAFVARWEARHVELKSTEPRWVAAVTWSTGRWAYVGELGAGARRRELDSVVAHLSQDAERRFAFHARRKPWIGKVLEAALLTTRTGEAEVAGLALTIDPSPSDTAWTLVGASDDRTCLWVLYLPLPDEAGRQAFLVDHVSLTNRGNRPRFRR